MYETINIIIVIVIIISNNKSLKLMQDTLIYLYQILNLEEY